MILSLLFSWGGLAAILACISTCSYMWAIVQGKVRYPVYSTWGIWVVLNVIFLTSYWGVGARLNTTLLVPSMALITSTLTFFLALKYGTWRWSRFETIATLICIATIIIWKTTNMPVLGLLGGIVIDVLATAPQIRKAWREPQDEVLFTWLLGAVANATNFLALDHWSFGLILYPLNNTTLNLLVALPLLLYALGVYHRTK